VTDTVTGYDGNGYTVGDRVELHPGTDLWMRGARYATVVGLSLTPKDRVKVELDKRPGRTYSGSPDTFRAIGPCTSPRRNTMASRLLPEGHTWEEVPNDLTGTWTWECACGATFTACLDQGGETTEYEEGEGHHDD